MDLLTTSAQRAFRTCPRLYLIKYEQGYRPLNDPEPLRFGKLGHHGLEAWWRAAAEDPDNPDVWWGAALAAIEREEPEGYQRSRAHALMWGYHCRWQTDCIRVLGVEVEFVGPLCNPETGGVSQTWLAAGKLDAIVEVYGRIAIVEHKTTSEDVAPGSDYWTRLHLDPQVTNYVNGARMLGYDADGAIYDVLRKPRLAPLMATPVEQRRYTKPRKDEPSRLYAGQRDRDEEPDAYYQRTIDTIAEDVESYYQRAFVVRLEDEEREGALDLWQTGTQIRDARRLSVWPRNPDACQRYGRRCDFWDACAGLASLDDRTRYRRVENPHEELTLAGLHMAQQAAENTKGTEHA